MSDIVLSGVITHALPVQSGVGKKSGQPWAKCGYVIQHEQGQFPKHFYFEVFGQDKINEFALRIGENVTVHLNGDAHENPNKPGQWLNETRCWKVERGVAQQAAQQPMQQPVPPAQPQVVYQNQPGQMPYQQVYQGVQQMMPQQPQNGQQADDGKLPF